ncbi:ATP-dependent DDX5 DEAD-box RNA helicase [Andalucia godoyi]|uniref:Probable eukaryotic initiation factor 4A n=1 Tax=Andalucia godoyi TaxID=505711 RepID=A0A8K0F439_ANDGO|nr:ATP-dependent DDX5 DEAD-box RNA helicase [Andalucia godoyi]|eukprot:ANDGO_06130.mRNA.1 ATP-dependent DDX5 DEAD-box RNA helicase
MFFALATSRRQLASCTKPLFAPRLSLSALSSSLQFLRLSSSETSNPSGNTSPSAPPAPSPSPSTLNNLSVPSTSSLLSDSQASFADSNRPRRRMYKDRSYEDRGFDDSSRGGRKTTFDRDASPPRSGGGDYGRGRSFGGERPSSSSYDAPSYGSSSSRGGYNDRSSGYGGGRSSPSYGGGSRGGSYDSSAPRSYGGGYGGRETSSYGGSSGAGGGYSRGGVDSYGAKPVDGATSGYGAPQEEASPSTPEPFTKNFYKEHPDVTARTDREIADYLKEHTVLVKGAEVPKPLFRFEEAGFPSFVQDSLRRAGFEKPSIIQSQAWPTLLSGRDLIAVAETGSGKTLGFMLPAFVHLRDQRPIRHGEGPIVLVLAPTRELAMQIDVETKKFAGASKVRSAVIYGGQPRGGQIRQLRQGAEIVVATPGRLNDFLREGIINLNRVTYLVLDEADRMLDMGFEPQIREIVDQIRADRQTAFFTATWPKDVRELARDFMSEDTVQINVGSTELTANPRVKQEFYFVGDHQKQDKLLDIIRDPHVNDGGRILVFVAKKVDCDYVARAITQHTGLQALSIHGDKTQSERDYTLQTFRNGRCTVMVATDVAARGLGMFSCLFLY